MVVEPGRFRRRTAGVQLTRAEASQKLVPRYASTTAAKSSTLPVVKVAVPVRERSS